MVYEPTVHDPMAHDLHARTLDSAKHATAPQPRRTREPRRSRSRNPVRGRRSHQLVAGHAHGTLQTEALGCSSFRVGHQGPEGSLTPTRTGGSVLETIAQGVPSLVRGGARASRSRVPMSYTWAAAALAAPSHVGCSAPRCWCGELARGRRQGRNHIAVHRRPGASAGFRAGLRRCRRSTRLRHEAGLPATRLALNAVLHDNVRRRLQRDELPVRLASRKQRYQ